MRDTRNLREEWWRRIKLPRSLVHAVVFLTVFATPTHSKQPQMTIKDVVDKTREAREVSLSAIDFLSAGDTSEVDLRQLGIHVPDDPTLGRGTDGDIARPKSIESIAGKKTDIGDKQQIMRDENGIARASIRQQYRKWPNNEIPYALSSQYGAYSRSIIAKAMNEYHTKTCVRFVARDPRKHRDYVFIHPDDGCYSLGRVGGRQPLSLDSGCIQVGTIVHELMHAVGFFHEQSRYDRDNFIDIVWSNVVKGADDQFERYGINVIDQLNEPYDYSSIMHYGPYAFSSNGRKTIVPRRAGAEKMGQRVAFSEIDLRKINKLYQCGGAMNAPASSVSASVPPPLPPLTGSRPGSGIISGFVSPFSQTDTSCTDENWRCLFWSLPELDYCNAYTEIRLHVCRQSCGTCGRLLPPLQPMTSSVPVVGDVTATTIIDNGGAFTILPAGTVIGAETRRHPIRLECIDRSLMCEQIVRSDDLSCLMPLTRKLCRRSCGNCARSADDGSDVSLERNDPESSRLRTVISDGPTMMATGTSENFSSFPSSPICADFSDWRVCRNVVATRMCAMRNDCLRTCGQCG